MANAFKLPIAVFFFSAPGPAPLSERFRTLGSELFNEIPPHVRLLMRKERAFQMGLEELCDGRNPAAGLITRDLQSRSDIRLEDAGISEIAAAIRDYLGVGPEEQMSWPDNDGCDTALKQWRAGPLVGRRLRLQGLRTHSAGGLFGILPV